MKAADWRALIEAYLDGRLSAEAFMRRFIEGWQAGAPLPRSIGRLQPAVEAYEAQVGAALEEGAVNDDELRQAAQRALTELRAEPELASHTFDRTRAREEMRRFQVSASRILGLGCLIALTWVALCVLQINFVVEWVHANAIPSVWLAAVLGFFLAFVPVLGNALAFLGATASGWNPWVAGLVFFAAPALTLLSGWSRWRRRN
jgi:hypothetical protein